MNSGSPPEKSPGEVVQALRQQIARLEQARQPAGRRPITSGCPALDRLLPEGGFRWGTLVEWLATESGSGAETLAILAAHEACRDGGALVVLDVLREFYAPAAVRLGVAVERLIVVQPADEADHLWALDQSLRSPAVAAVLAWLGRLDQHTFRRLQLAAEEGGGLGLLIRPASTRHEPSLADVRLAVAPLPAVSAEDGSGGGHGSCGTQDHGWLSLRESIDPFAKRKATIPAREPLQRPPPSLAVRRVRVELLRGRGSLEGQSVEVEINDETHPECLAPRLAPATTRRRAAGA